MSQHTLFSSLMHSYGLFSVSHENLSIGMHEGSAAYEQHTLPSYLSISHW